MTEVKCRVRSCHYWGNGDICEANKIEVDNRVGAKTAMEVGELGADYGRRQDREAAPGTTRAGARDAGGLVEGRARGTAMEIGELAPGAERRVGEPLASTSEEAVCRTFRPKGSTPEGYKPEYR
ncbi:MAG TPA: DUF1540 domain-containing protein [Firmicutes bacterium]|nr:DUF1540 domain-containing protein [Candidatus Fermentithermobacillaceae bacterium]